MESLCTPWGLPPPAYSFTHQQNRSRYSSTLDIRETCPASAQQDLLPRRQRSPSLPPILHFQSEPDQPPTESIDNNSIKYINKSNQDHRQGNSIKYRYEDVEGETSGYASDTVPQSSPEYWQNKQQYNNNNNRLEHIEYTRNQLTLPEWHQSSRKQEEDRQKRWTREGVSVEEQRPRWGDRGVATGRLWEPQEPGARLPQVPAKGAPTWVERSLNLIDNGDSQILIIDQQSNHSSGGDGIDYRTMSEQNSEKNTYLLGQNAPIEPNIKAEREYKRLKALELQAAIMQQLEDRERQKREEKERRIREEREEEERFRKQQELEQQRLEEERKMAEEKQKRELKRAEALRLALERAEHQAKLDKENKKNRRFRESFDSMSLTSDEIHIDRPAERSPRKEMNQHVTSANSESKMIQNIYIEQAFSPGRNMIQDQKYKTQGPTETNIIMSNPQSARFSRQSESIPNETQYSNKKIETPRTNSSEALSAILNSGQPVSILPDASMSLVQIPLAQDMFTPINFGHSNGVQMAFLVPQNINSIYPCIHQPISMQTLFAPDSNNLHKNNYTINSHTDTDDSSTKERGKKLLTPSKYRNPNCKDASTQTEVESIPIKNTEEKDKKRNKFIEHELEVNAEQHTSEEKLNSLKKEKRLQSEERLVMNKDLETRPKWGVNKPPTQYKKQSEKDIFYTQKRRLRQRKRAQEKVYTSHSSDDNRSPSPVKNTSENNRVSLTDYHWRKKAVKSDLKNSYSGNTMVETSQTHPLECDQAGIVHIGENINYNNKKAELADKKPFLPKTNVTLSQKFMNDRYGNPKLWQEQTLGSELKNKYEESKYKHESKKRYPTKKDQSNFYGDENTNQPLILDQLRSLRDSLKKQQQIWGKYDTHRRSPSPKNEVDLELE